MPVPAITLIARNEIPVREAFREFNAWAAQTDGDALELTFIFRSDGSYLLVLAPETTRLQRRTLGYNRTSHVLVMTLMWVFPVTTTHPALRTIREYCKGFPAPIMFSAARLPPLLVAPSATASELRPVAGVKPLLKFSLTLVDESDVTPHSTAWAALQSASMKGGSSSREKPPPPEPAATGEMRAKMLRAHFPVTLERLQGSKWFDEMCLSLHRDHGVRRWQVEQAICNLVLSEETVGRPHFAGLGSRELADLVVKALDRRYEVANGSTLAPLSAEHVVTQIVADTSQLLSYYRRPSRLAALGAANASLASAELLDAPSATVAISSELIGSATPAGTRS
jgi:hypothetical protein